MKLIKQSKKKAGDNQCCAITKSGKRCKRKIFDGDLCRQHYEMKQSITRKLSEYPGGVLDELPDPPVNLLGDYNKRWKQVCEMLFEFDQLRGGYLKEIQHMILLEMLLDDIMEALKDGNMKDYLNEYTTESGHPGNNINGLWVIKRDTEKELADIKKRLWLTPNGLIHLAKGKDLLAKTKTESASLRKVKSWT